MVISTKQEAKTLSPLYLIDVCSFDNDDNIYCIEETMQREYVWSFGNIETLWNDIFECIKLNIEESKQGLFDTVYNNKWCDIGNFEISEVDECNKQHLIPLEKGFYYSIVDGSQRDRGCIAATIAFLYLIAKMNKQERVDLSTMKHANGTYKLIQIGSNKLSDFYNIFETNTIENINKRLVPNETLAKNMMQENKERNYFDIFNAFVNFIERDVVGVYDISTSFKIYLNNTFFWVEWIDISRKFQRFVDRNKKGTPMSDESMYPKFIINQYEGNEKMKVFGAFKNFEKAASICEKPNGETTTGCTYYKSNQSALLYIMIEVLKIKYGEESIVNPNIDLYKIFVSTFNLSNFYYGIQRCFSDGYIFHNYKDAIDYFRECENFAKFLIEDSFTRHEGDIYRDCYMLRGFDNPNMIWWYFMKPSYLAETRLNNVLNRKSFEFVKKAFVRLYFYYCINRPSNTNSQSLINTLEYISTVIITNANNEKALIKEIRNVCINYVTDKEKGKRKKKKCAIEIGEDRKYDHLPYVLNSLTYKITSHQNAIACIFKAMEYDICEQFGLDTYILYGLWKKDGNLFSYNIDHLYPQNKFKNDENEIEYEKLGNLVLIEGSLNKSKQDKNEKNSIYYTQSKYIQTLLFDNKNRGTFPNKIIDKINNYPYLSRVDTELINNPTLDFIKERGKIYVDFAIHFIKDFFEDMTDE